MEDKFFLDPQGLALYDSLIKEYIDTHGSQPVEAEKQRAMQAEANLLQALTALSQNLTAAEGNISTNAAAIELLNGDAQTEGSVSYKVKTAIAEVVDGAPEAFDTLKEIADWIAEEGEAVAALIARVAAVETKAAANESAIDQLKGYVDAQDREIKKSFKTISELDIRNLFKTKVQMTASETLADKLETLTENQILVLPSNYVNTEDLNITVPCTIDGNGAKFAGHITVADDVDVVIMNATFDNEVVIGGVE